MPVFAHSEYGHFSGCYAASNWNDFLFLDVIKTNINDFIKGIKNRGFKENAQRNR